MRVMSFNVLCGGVGKKFMPPRKEGVIKRIKQANPDTFGLQEAHKQWMRCVIDNLPEYDYVGVGRDDGAWEGEFSPVFFRRDKYEAVDSGTFWLSETPDVPSKGWDGACTRVCSWAVLRKKSNGKEFLQLNTHLDHIGEEARVKGIALVVDKINEFALPAVCTGDFNTDEGSPAYKIITAEAMDDAKYLASDSDDGITFHDFDPEGMKNNSPIDFIFVKKGAFTVNTYKIMRETIDGKHPSDHFAIYSDMSII